MKKTSTEAKTHPAKRFDPFSDRLSRDIRNSLSVAFIRSIKQRNVQILDQKARKWLNQDLALVYTDYIQSRLERYRDVFDQILQDRASELLTQAVYLWNAGLFFEVHEMLEGFWRGTSGDKREALKGLIKAATAYAHLDSGHQKAWESLCAKSAKLLGEHGEHLPFLSNLDVLIRKMENVDPRPPELVVDVK